MLCCSFCGRKADQTKALLAGPEVNICDNCISVGVRTIEVRDALETVSPTNEALAGTSDEVLLSHVSATSQLIEGETKLLRKQIGELRRRGVGWPAVAASLGVTEQDARRRFLS